MSQLQKAISRVQRRESPRTIGFGVQAREQPRSMLLAVLAEDAASARAAIEAGADLAVLRGGDVVGAVAEVAAAAKEPLVGAWLDTLDSATGEALAQAGCDFVIGTLEGTDATAIDTERMGQVVVASPELDDTTLRSLAPLGLDALLVERDAKRMSLAAQLQLVRIASFAATPLIVTTSPDAPAADLRVLRDSGAVAVLLPAGTSADQIRAMGERLKSLPPRKSRREGGEIALVPALAATREPEEIEHPDEDE